MMNVKVEKNTIIIKKLTEAGVLGNGHQKTVKGQKNIYYIKIIKD